MPAPTVIIKKYENRRLYDSTNSRYVNLEEIAQMVRDGIDVQVVDAASGEDLTRLVLTQIIAENAKGPDSTFPVDMLRQMVIASGRVGREGVLGYVKAMSDMYQSTFKAFAAGAPPFPFEPPRAEAPPNAAAPQKNEPSVEELHRRVDELERMVKKTSGAKAPARGPRRKQA
jgi:polyhydroxyalkanoate synthesis repressor PhaR